MNLRRYVVFRAVIDTGSVSAAAKLLRLAQPAVSRHIKDLEGELRVSLFDRTRKRLVPTADALALYQQTRAALANVEQFLDRARDLTNKREAPLRIACAPLFSTVAISRLVQRVRAQHPTASFTVIVRDPTIVTQMVASGDADIGLCGIATASQTLDVRKLLSAELICAIPAGHPLAQRRVIEASALKDVPFIALAQEVTPIVATAKLLQREKVEPLTVVETQRTHTVYSLVADGIGVSLVEPLTALAYPADKVVIRPFLPAVEISYDVILPPGRPHTAVTNSVLKAAMALCADFAREIGQRLRT